MVAAQFGGQGAAAGPVTPEVYKNVWLTVAENVDNIMGPYLLDPEDVVEGDYFSF